LRKYRPVDGFSSLVAAHSQERIVTRGLADEQGRGHL
jgi:hypothetical protein